MHGEAPERFSCKDNAFKQFPPKKIFFRLLCWLSWTYFQFEHKFRLHIIASKERSIKGSVENNAKIFLPPTRSHPQTLHILKGTQKNYHLNWLCFKHIEGFVCTTNVNRKNERDKEVKLENHVKSCRCGEKKEIYLLCTRMVHPAPDDRSLIWVFMVSK